MSNETRHTPPTTPIERLTIDGVDTDYGLTTLWQTFINEGFGRDARTAITEPTEPTEQIAHAQTLERSIGGSALHTVRDTQPTPDMTPSGPSINTLMSAVEPATPYRSFDDTAFNALAQILTARREHAEANYNNFVHAA